MTPDVLLVFAKVPYPGHVKTRLTAALSPEDAAALYRAFLRDALDQYAGLGVDVRLYLAPSEHTLSVPLPDGVTVHTQRGADLGARMLNAFVEAFGSGYERAVVIGSDHPTLPSGFIQHAFASLEAPFSIVIGPSEDGGYYLLGKNDLVPALFVGMTYSHGDVFANTLARAAGLRHEVTVLPRWYDVDDPAALRRLADDLVATDAPLVHTRRQMARLKPMLQHGS